MPHHTHKITAYRDSQNVWASFCEWCGCDDDGLQNNCSERYKPVDIVGTNDKILELKSGE